MIYHYNSLNFKFKVKFNNEPPQTHVSKYTYVLPSYASVCMCVCLCMYIKQRKRRKRT